MRNLLHHLIRVRVSYADPTEHQQAQRLLWINLVWLGLSLLGVPVLIWWQSAAPHLDAVTLYMPITLILALILHRQIQRGQFRRARLLFVLNILGASLLAIFPNYRLDTTFILILTLPLTAAGVLLRRPGLFGVALFLALVVTLGGLIQIGTGMEPTPAGNTAAESIRTTILVFLGIVTLHTVMLWTFLGGIEDTLHQQRHLAHLIDTTTQTSQILVALPATGEELNRAVEQLRDALGLYHIQVFLADPVSGFAVLQASTGFIGRRLLEEESLLMPPETSPVNDALRVSDPVLILESAPPEQRDGFLPATRSELLVPLRVGNLLPIGVLDLHSTAADAFSKDMLDTLRTISNQMAIALYTVQQTKELRTSYQERDTLIEQIGAAQRELARINRQLIGATWGTYLEEHRATVPALEWHQGAVEPSSADSQVMARTLHAGQPYLEQRDGQDVLCVPIRLRGQTLGAVEFRRSGEKGWSPAALELAQAVAERLALSLENARLFEQAQTTARREQLVSQITTQLQVSNDLQTLLTLAASQFQDALGATFTRVRLGLPSSDLPVQQE